MKSSFYFTIGGKWSNKINIRCVKISIIQYTRLYKRYYDIHLHRLKGQENEVKGRYRGRT